MDGRKRQWCVTETENMWILLNQKMFPSQIVETITPRRMLYLCFCLCSLHWFDRADGCTRLYHTLPQLFAQVANPCQTNLVKEHPVEADWLSFVLIL